MSREFEKNGIFSCIYNGDLEYFLFASCQTIGTRYPWWIWTGWWPPWDRRRHGAQIRGKGRGPLETTGSTAVPLAT